MTLSYYIGHFFILGLVSHCFNCCNLIMSLYSRYRILGQQYLSFERYFFLLAFVVSIEISDVVSPFSFFFLSLLYLDISLDLVSSSSVFISFTVWISLFFFLLEVHIICSFPSVIILSNIASVLFFLSFSIMSIHILNFLIASNVPLILLCNFRLFIFLCSILSILIYVLVYCFFFLRYI